MPPYKMLVQLYIIFLVQLYIFCQSIFPIQTTTFTKVRRVLVRLYMAAAYVCSQSPPWTLGADMGGGRMHLSLRESRPAICPVRAQWRRRPGLCSDESGRYPSHCGAESEPRPPYTGSAFGAGAGEGREGPGARPPPAPPPPPPRES
jgi:hypothetical protein